MAANFYSIVSLLSTRKTITKYQVSHKTFKLINLIK